ncbi:expressed unknown protein [Seminavis robusta]|uniref:Uncharacterized protein n=1 Tax=Seminavis robusta TaxID=568900 RepID=A0A9N8ER65_9STRA|nr:expressed unknown protein [Seminavis robusta]|eukprot:Sro1386_g268270.1 n/a (343) ;mRNA; r:13127-14880
MVFGLGGGAPSKRKGRGGLSYSIRNAHSPRRGTRNTSSSSTGTNTGYQIFVVLLTACITTFLVKALVGDSQNINAVWESKTTSSHPTREATASSPTATVAYVISLAGFTIVIKDPPVHPHEIKGSDHLKKHIHKENHPYDGGFSRENGWGNAGYGGYVGAMAMQGLVAYYYDVVRPNTSLELNSCRFNHMGMDNLYRAHPNFKARSEWVGKCRSTRPDCQDCTITNDTQIYNVHYTQCRKPWNCVSEGTPGGSKGKTIDTTTGKLEHCLPLIKKWHDVRKDLQTKLYQLSKDERILDGSKGTHKKDLFHGHCSEEGSTGYLQIQAKNETFAKLPTLYGDKNR